MPRKPFRSPLLGYTLLVVGGAALLSILVVDWRPGNQARGGALPIVFTSLFLGPVLMMLGASLIRSDARAILADPASRPIVYLRPFDQERVSSPGNLPWKAFAARFRLEPMNVVLGAGFLAAFGGIAAGLLSMAGGWLATVSKVLMMAYLPIVYLLILYAPFYAYRKMRGRADVTLEQELCHHLKGFGPIVAVGRPGELLAPEGGARVYLDDDSWQATVLESIRRSRMIVVHLVPEGWTWWEVGRSFANHDPTRILGVVVGASLTDSSYERLREKMSRELGITLNQTRAEFDLYRFDADLTPHVLPLKWIPWPLWPFRAYRLGRSTFEPYLDGLGLCYRFSGTWWRERLAAFMGGDRRERESG